MLRKDCMERVVRCTMLDLILSLRRFTRDEAEIVAVVKYLVNSGQVELCGSFSGTRF